MSANLTYLSEFSTKDTLAFFDSSTSRVVTMSPDAANAAANGGLVSNAPPAEGASSSMSGIENAALGGAILSLGSSVSGIITSLIGYAAAKNQMDFQRKSTMSNLDHQDTMAVKQMEIAKDNSYWQERNIDSKVEGQKQYNAAVENRVKAENQLKVVKARIAEKNKSEKAGKLNTKAVDRLFRSKYSYGAPIGF